MLALPQFFPQSVDGPRSVNRFAPLDLLQAGGDFLAEPGGVCADEFLLRPQHAQALSDNIARRMVMATLELFGNELLLLGC
jgi:hypothetical protein